MGERERKRESERKRKKESERKKERWKGMGRNIKTFGCLFEVIRTKFAIPSNAGGEWNEVKFVLIFS